MYSPFVFLGGNMELISYMFSMFAVFFWLFRLVVSFAPSINLNIPFISSNPTIEIILLFISILGLIGIFKRKTFLTAIYLASFFAYYGYELVSVISSSQDSLSSLEIQNMTFYVAGILIALVNFLDVLLNKERKGSTKDTKLDWYYDEGKFEREKDERSDQNRYRIK